MTHVKRVELTNAREGETLCAENSAAVLLVERIEM